MHLVKSLHDVCTKVVVTHDGSKARQPDQVVERLGEVKTDASVIGIDELHFFEDGAKQVELWVAEGRQIYATMVDTGFTGERMPTLVQLEEAGVQFAEIRSLANCNICGAKGSATCTARLTPLGASAVGGKEHYAATCYRCFAHHHVFINPCILLANPEEFDCQPSAFLRAVGGNISLWCHAV